MFVRQLQCETMLLFVHYTCMQRISSQSYLQSLFFHPFCHCFLMLSIAHIIIVLGKLLMFINLSYYRIKRSPTIIINKLFFVIEAINLLQKMHIELKENRTIGNKQWKKAVVQCVQLGAIKYKVLSIVRFLLPVSYQVFCDEV